jgi:hypothetical protein
LVHPPPNTAKSELCADPEAEQRLRGCP